MAQIIGQQTKVLSLFPPGKVLGSLTTGIEEVVGRSFVEQRMRNPTHAEVKRRFEICMKWAITFRGDLKWGIQRIVDELANALRAELLGQAYSPPTRQCWIQQDGS